MKIKLSNLILFRILYLIAAGIIITQVLGMEEWTSMLFILTFPVTVILWVTAAKKTLLMSDLIMLLAIILAVINVLLDASLHVVDFSFSYIRKVIMFAMSLVFFQTTYRTSVDYKMTRFVDGLVDLLTVFLLVMYYTRGPQMHLYNGVTTRYLTFRFTNPNLTGLFLTCLYMLEAYRLFSPEKWYWKLIHIAMAVFLARCVLETESRNCLLAMVAFTVASGWLIFRSRRKLRITKLWASLIAWTPAVFAVGYLMFVNASWLLKAFAFLIGEGKRLNSRLRIWVPAVQAIRESPLIGAYYDISNGTGMSQMHNSHMDIAGSYGVVVLSLVCILIAEYLHQKNRYHEDKSSFIYILGFACAIMLGIGEAALFSGGLGIYIFVGTFLLLANRKE